MVTGTAMRCRLELAELLRKHGIKPPAQRPPALLPPVDGDVIVEGIASPATSFDLERMRFAADCWRPFKPDTPLLFRHQADQIAGRILELRATNQGLFVKALVSHTEAKRCPAFSLTATIHDFVIMDRDNRDQVHALILDSSLEEITMATHPTHPSALVAKRTQPGSFDVFIDSMRTYAASVSKSYDLHAAAFAKSREIVQQLMTASAAQPRPATPMRKHRPEIKAGAAKIYGHVPARPRGEPHRASEFGRFVEKLERVQCS